LHINEITKTEEQVMKYRLELENLIYIRIKTL